MVMNTGRGVKRKRGPAKPLPLESSFPRFSLKICVQSQAQSLSEQILSKLHHSLQEFKRLAKQAKVNETQIVVRKLKSLRSSSDKLGMNKHDPSDFEAQLDALKALNPAHFAAATLTQRLRHNRTLFADKTVSEFLSTELQPSLPSTYLSVRSNSTEGKIRNRLMSCKSFSGRASGIVTDLQAILDPSVAKLSTLTARHTAAVDDKEEVSEDQAEDGEGEDDFFDQPEFSDDKGWELGSVYSEDDSLPIGLPTMPTSSGSASDSESDTPLPSSKVSKHSRGAGTSTFLPPFSVGYIPGTGDSHPEDELEAVEDKNGRKNRRGQRARRAIREKKYGKGAKHVVKQWEEETEKKRIKGEKGRQREAAAKRPIELRKRSSSLQGERIRGVEGGLPQSSVVAVAVDVREGMGDLH